MNDKLKKEFITEWHTVEVTMPEDAPAYGRPFFWSGEENTCDVIYPSAMKYLDLTYFRGKRTLVTIQEI